MQGKCVVSLRDTELVWQELTLGGEQALAEQELSLNIPHREEVVLASEEATQKVVKGPRWAPEDLCPSRVSEQKNKREWVSTGVTQ